jgi:putative hydrolase of the HAD superfamily
MHDRYRYLFFDLDHTLWDFEKNSVQTLMVMYDQLGLRQLGIEDFEDFNAVYHQINDKLWDRFRKGFLSREELRWKRMFQTLIHYRIYDEQRARDMSELYLEILPTQNHLFPHAKEVLEYCTDKKYELHLITNGFELTQHQKLKNAGIQQFFQQMMTSEQAMSMKPQPEIFKYAFQQTGAESRNSLMIGDALDIDVLGAARVGMDQVYFNPHSNPHTDHPTYEISCLSALKNIV